MTWIPLIEYKAVISYSLIKNLYPLFKKQTWISPPTSTTQTKTSFNRYSSIINCWILLMLNHYSGLSLTKVYKIMVHSKRSNYLNYYNNNLPLYHFKKIRTLIMSLTIMDNKLLLPNINNNLRNHLYPYPWLWTFYHIRTIATQYLLYQVTLCSSCVTICDPQPETQTYKSV